MKEGFAVEGREVKNEMLLEAQCKILQSFEDRIWGGCFEGEPHASESSRTLRKINRSLLT